MAAKFLYSNSGAITEKEATVTSAGSTNAGEIPALDSSGKLDPTVMPSGVGADTYSIEASEAISAGAWVNIYYDTGTVYVRNADASSTAKKADGFVKAAVASGANATVYVNGVNDALSSLSPGEDYFLSGDTAGAGTTTAPSTAGYLCQKIGTAISATAIPFHSGPVIVLA